MSLVTNIIVVWWLQAVSLWIETMGGRGQSSLNSPGTGQCLYLYARYKLTWKYSSVSVKCTSKVLQNCIIRLCLLRNAQNYVKWCVVVDVLFLLLCVFSGVRHILHLLQRVRGNYYHYLACAITCDLLNLLRLVD